MSLRHSYTLIAPWYDLLLRRATAAARRRSLRALHERPAGEVLVAGIGTGLDLPHLPAHHRYTGIDLTPAMLGRLRRQPAPAPMHILCGDVQSLPFANGSFDAVVLHLILAVVPHPERCLAEAARVVRPGGSLHVFDKFLRPGQSAPLRRALNPLTRHLATRLDVVLEDLLVQVPDLHCASDHPAMAGGWFRLVRLERKN